MTDTAVRLPRLKQQYRETIVPQLREGLIEAERLVDVSGVVPRGVSGRTIGAGTTLAEIADHYGISRERVRQIEAEALRKLRSPKLSERFRDYL